MNITRDSKLSEEEVLQAFSVEPDHHYQTLERYLNNYPEYAVALVDLSIELDICDSIYANEKDLDSDIIDTVNKDWDLFNSLLTKDTPSDPLLNATRVEFKLIASKLKVNGLFLTRLRDKQIDLITIPNQFIERMSTVLNISLARMRLLLDSDPTISSAVSFKSEQAPKAQDKISFENAVETSGLTNEQQMELKKLN